MTISRLMFRSGHKDNIKVKERSDPTSSISITSITLNTVYRELYLLAFMTISRSGHKDNIKGNEVTVRGLRVKRRLMSL